MGLSPSIGVSQRVTDFNPRSTVGTKTGILTILRNLFASIGHQPCAGCGKTVKQPLQDKNKLTTIEIEEEKAGSSSKKKKRSYFDCPNCGQQLEKLKMAHFSFNATSGACEACKGVGEMIGVDIPNLLNEEKTIKNGGVNFWDQAVAEYYEGVIQAAVSIIIFLLTQLCPYEITRKSRETFYSTGLLFRILSRRTRISKSLKR